MKLKHNRLGLLARLAATSTAILLSQHAFAAGTDPNTQVNTTVTVDYEVNGTGQAQLSSVANFVVDRRVDFSVDQVGATLTQVTPGQTGVWIEFLVTNLSNGVLDFNLNAVQLGSTNGDVRGAGTEDSDVDMDNVTISVSTAADGGTPGAGPDPALGGATVINDLPEDDSIRVRVFADTPAGITDTQIANIRLDVTAADPATGTNLVSSGTWDPDNVDNVFADDAGFDDAAGDGIVNNADGFQAVSAALTVTKTSAVVDDPFSSGLAVPGAVIEYTITFDNTAGSVAATNVVVNDPVDTDVTLVLDAYNGGSSNISFDSGSSFCLADNTGGDASDACTFDGSSLNITSSDGGTNALSVPAGGSLTIQYQVTIPTT